MKQTAATRKRVTKTQSKKSKPGGHAVRLDPATGTLHDDWDAEEPGKSVGSLRLKKRGKWNAFQDLPKRADGTEEGINTSQIQEFIRCGYRWHLRNRRMIDRREIAPAMDLGSAVHAALGGAIKQYALAQEFGPRLSERSWGLIDKAALKGITEFRDEWLKEHSINISDVSEETLRQLKDICDKAWDIFDLHINELDLERYEVLWLQGRPLVEQKIVIPFVDGVLYYGTPDVVWKDRDKGGNWVADYKVREKMQAVEHEEVDLQLPAYQYMLDRLGIPTTGSMKIQIRAELPKKPEITKKGQMSRMRIMTTWDVYKKALIENGMNPLHYEEEMKQKLDCEFFRLDQLYRNQFEIASFWTNIIEPLGRTLIEAKNHIRHMHFMNCAGCWARDFCLAELRGEDPGFLLETQYIDATAPQPKLVLRAEDVVLEDA